MRCNVCGAQVDDGTKTCPYCGCAVEGDGKEATVYSASGEEKTGESKAPVYGATSFADSSLQRESEPAVGLKWAHFLGYFALWLSTLGNLANGFAMLTGSIYETQGVSADMVYSFWGNSLKYADKFYAVCLFVLSILAIVAAVSILKYKAIAGTLVCALYALNAISGIGYIAMTTHILGQSTLDYRTGVGILGSIVFFCINIVYFKKRKHIFVN